MSSVKWIKITTTMFDDEKIRLIESMPEKDTILVIWIKLLALCGKCNQDGRILLSGDIAYTDEMLCSLFNRPINSIRLALDVFNKFKMIEIEDGTIEVVNWYKYQSLDGLEKIREQNKERNRRYRERLEEKKENKNKRTASHVTSRNVTDISLNIPPDINDVKYYCSSRNNNVDADKWYNFYDAKGWMIGKNKMKSWKAAVHTWEKNRHGDVTESDKQIEEFMKG